MDTIGTHQPLNIAVLRKQRDRRNRLVRQHAFKVFGQCKTGLLDLGRGILAAQLGMLDKFLDRRFHGTQNQCRCTQTHHLKCTYRLMQLLTGNTQLTGIKRCQVGPTRQLGVANKTFQGLGGAVQ